MTHASRDARLGTALRPADVCRQLLAALDAAEGRRRRRKRNTTPDAIGMTIKRTLLEDTVREDPSPDAYEGWLLDQCLKSGDASGPVRAMALDVLAEWRMAQKSEQFRDWLAQGAPSDDSGEMGHRGSGSAGKRERD
ncbi:MAG TPA: hypothetical protein VHH32_10445 [Gemmatimonadales bacterium]|nr:hypothetical protein [Gemmatimonadales bacterium]